MKTIDTVLFECEDNLAFMGRLPDASMKLIVTSPPYNIGKQYEQRATMSAYLQNQTDVIHECVRLLHPNGSLCWQVGTHIAPDREVIPLDLVLYPLFKAEGLRMKNRIVWHYGHGLHASRRFSGRYETILWFTKGEDYTFNLDPVRVPSKYPGKRHYKGPRKGELSGNPLGKNPSDIWEIPNVKHNHPEKTIHPCQFPVELVERLVLALTNPGDAVLDPYAGVGSALVAAVLHERAAYGCDIEQMYISIGRDRITQASSGTLKTRPMGRPIYNKDGKHFADVSTT